MGLDKQIIVDKIAIGFSLICLIHCIFLPLAIFVLPWLAMSPVESELFNHWMFVMVLPSSLYALTMGIRKHKHLPVLIWGILGLVLLGGMIYFGHEKLTEALEITGLLLGASLMLFSHLRNIKLSKNSACDC